MDPKAIANRKAGALERIDAGLAVLSSQFKLDAGLGVQLRRTYPDPDLADMRRLEDVADLIEALVDLTHPTPSPSPDGKAPSGEGSKAAEPAEKGKTKKVVTTSVVTGA